MTWLQFWIYHQWITKFLQPGLVAFFSLVIAAIIAWSTIKSNRKIARVKNTLDTIVRLTVDQNHMNAMLVYYKLCNEPQAIRHDLFTNPQPSDDYVIKESLRTLINYAELVSLGCSQKVFEKKMIKDWCGSYLVGLWNFLLPITDDVRQKKTKRLLKEFEILARDFAKDLKMEFKNPRALK